MKLQDIPKATTVVLLKAYKNKARCRYSSRTSRFLNTEIVQRITEAENRELSISVAHMNLGEGCEEFDEVTDKLIAKYNTKVQ